MNRFFGHKSVYPLVRNREKGLDKVILPTPLNAIGLFDEQIVSCWTLCHEDSQAKSCFSEAVFLLHLDRDPALLLRRSVPGT